MDTKQTVILDYLYQIYNSPIKKTAIAAATALSIYLLKNKFSKINSNIKVNDLQVKDKKSNGNVDFDFFKKLARLIKIAIPRLIGKETITIFLLSVLLVLRTVLSIYISDIRGSTVRSIVRKDLPSFIRQIITLTLYSFPSSTVNSGLDYYNKKIGLYFRQNLVSYFQKQYLEKMCFYQIINLDSRITHPDQIITTDIELWSNSVANLYSNISKPILDLVLFMRKLSKTMGIKGPLFMVGWYIFSAFIIKYITPPFGKLTAINQVLEGEFRACHSSLITHAEEIAFYRGHDFEKQRLNNVFDNLIAHMKDVAKKKLFMGTFDSLLTKYGAVLGGYTILGLPVFTGAERYSKKFQNDSSIITKDYIRNSSLLVNLAKAIGRIIYSYKDLQNLAGYTQLVDELRTVISDVNNEKYVKPQIKEHNLKKYIGGKVEEADLIEFDKVPIVTPTGDILIPEISFKIEQGHHTMILGPNGCGKSSLFRILGNLWPIKGGLLKKPNFRNIFYIPQKPYLPSGSLRDQIIYPHNYEEFKNSGKTDEDLLEFLRFFDISYLVTRNEKGFNAVKDWTETLAMGEKQLIAMARLYYHKPKYAILDECSSSVTIEKEAKMYDKAKEMNITLITVSHRTSVWKYHDYILRFKGDLTFSFEKWEKKEN